MSEDFMIGPAIVAGIMGVALIVIFVSMTDDIKAIKKRLATDEGGFYKYLALANEERALGNKDKEREYLIRAQCYVKEDEQREALQERLKEMENGAE